MLRQRILTALIAIAVLLIVLFVLPPVVAELVIAILVLAGAWEWSGFLGVVGTATRALYVALTAMLEMLVGLQLFGYSDVIFQIALVWWLCTLVWTFFFPTPIPVVIRWIGGMLVLVPLFLALLILYQTGPAVMLFALLIVWAADVGAFFTGKLFGRVKLAPSISPGKTWEGVIGGLLLVTLLTIGWSQWLETPLVVLLPFCLAIACASVIGDLTVSMFKRNAGLKDSGALFPGHGGVLDRIDSVAAAAPLFALGLAWAGLR